MKNNKIKLLYLIDILNKKTSETNPINANELIDELGKYKITCERKAIYDDINVLRQYGYDIIYSPNKGYFMGQRSFELSEIKIISDALNNASFLTSSKTLSIVDKLCNDQNINDTLLIKSNLVNYHKKTNDATIYHIDIIFDAINTNSTIEFKYFDYTISSQKKYRKSSYSYFLDPYALVWNDSNYYLVGYNQKHNAFINYRVDKMDQIKISTKFDKKSFDLDAYINTTFNMYQGNIDTITLSCQNNLSNVMFDKFKDNMIVTNITKDYFTINIKAQISPTFIGWLIQFKDQIKILEPASLVQELLSYSETIIKLYKD